MIVGYIGYGGHSHHAEKIRQALLDNGIVLKACHEHAGADVAWSVENAAALMEEADAIYLPSNYTVEDGKGTNRLAQAWSAKKAVVAMPMPSYLRHTKDGENCLLVNTPEEAIQAFVALKNDPALRKNLGDRGYSASFVFHPHSLAEKFVSVLRKEAVPGFWSPKYFLQVIIPHYQPRTDYLLLAVSSALMSHGPARDILVVSSSKEDPTPALRQAFGQKVRVHWQSERLSFSQANNLGIAQAHQNTTHFLLLNDDTIVGSQCLGKMMDEIGDRLILLNPYSNCDKGWLHHDSIKVAAEPGDPGEGASYREMKKLDLLDLHPGMSIEETVGFQETIRTLDQRDERFEGSEIKEAPFCAFYATMIPKEVVDRVGTLNTAFLSGSEDYDFAQRAKRMGFNCHWSTKSWCYHFGGRSRKVAEGENFNKHHEEDRHNITTMHRWWGNDGKKKRIAFWTGPAFEYWSCENYRVNGSGIGGSEYVEGSLAEAAAKEGHYVALYGCVPHRMEQYGVDIIPWQHFVPEETYFDLFVASRNLNCIDQRLRAKTRLLHIHDIWAQSGKHISEWHRNNVDKFIALSPWHKEFVKEYHELPDNKLEIIPNGINYDWFEDLTIEKKLEEVEWGRLHWSSSPDRGLSNVLYLLPWIMEKCPEVKVHVYYGFGNWAAAIKQRNNAQELREMEALQQQLESLKEHVVFHDRVNQVQLSREWRKAWLLCYPSLFTETSMLTSREAQLSYTPILCSNVAALQTTVGEYGHRVFHHPYSKEGREEFLAKIIEWYHNKDLWVERARLSHAATENGKYNWPNVWKEHWAKYL